MIGNSRLAHSAPRPDAHCRASRIAAQQRRLFEKWITLSAASSWRPRPPRAACRQRTAVARVAVGVDVEQVRPRSTTPHLEQRFLTPGERELLAQRANDHGESAFFIIWSRKEAYLKALGLGLAAPFSRVDSSTDRLPDVDEDGAPRAGEMPWSVREFFVDDRHPAAVVLRSRALSSTFLTFRSTHS